MSEKMNSADIVAAVRSAAEDVFATMLNMPLRLGTPREETERPPENLAGVVALVGIAGSWTGTGRISCTANLACRLAGALLMSEYTAINEDVLDAVAEVANMIIGNVKTIFEERLGPLGLSVPTVVFGRNYQTRTSGVVNWTVIPFECEDEIMEVRFCLMPSRTPSHTYGTPRPDVLQTA